MQRVLFIILVSAYTFLAAQFPVLTGTDNLKKQRVLHQSHLLPNGNVIVFGGSNGDLMNYETHNTAEIYNVSTNSWSYTGALNVRRESFASVVLPNGNIMAIGGLDANMEMLASCEIYNVATSTWSLVASLQQPRKSHAAILLKNGKVLVLGGTSWSGEKCELYDPISNTWSATTDMVLNHGDGVSVVMLNDGRILASGGSNSGAIRALEIFDPTSQNWTRLAAVHSKDRTGHNSILLNDGNVLFAGSTTMSFVDQVSAELFNTTTNTMSNVGNLVHNVGHCDMIKMDDGKVLIYGIGDLFAPSNTKCLQVYDPLQYKWAAGTYSTIGATNYSIHRLLNGKILIAGGNFTTGNGASQECLLINQPGYTNCTMNLAYAVTGQSTCFGKNVTVSVSGSESGTTYQPFLGDFALANAATGGSALSFTFPSFSLVEGRNVVKIKVTKGSNCLYSYLTDTAVVTITQAAIPVPTISFSGNPGFCAGGGVTLNCSAASSYLWSSGQASSGIYVNQSGLYSVRTFDATGCASPSSALARTELFNNTITAGSSENVCSNSTKTLSGQYPPYGVWSGTGVSANGTFNPQGLANGNYTVTYNQCSRTATKTVTIVDGGPVPDFTPTTMLDSICPNNSTYISVGSPTLGIYYRLLQGSTVVRDYVGYSGSPIRFDLNSTNKTVNYTVEGRFSNSCGVRTLSKDISINVAIPPSSETHLVLVEDTVCSINKAHFKIVNSKPYFYYRIKEQFNPPYFQGNGDTLVLPYSASVDYQTGVTKTIIVEAVDRLKCPTTELDIYRKQVEPYEHKVQFESSVGYYQNTPITFKNNSTGDQYQWVFDNTASTLGSTLKSPTLSYNSPGNKHVQLISQSRFGCVDTITKGIRIYSGLTSGSSGSVCFFDTVSSTVMNPSNTYYADEYSISKLHTDKFNNQYVLGQRNTPAATSSSESFYIKKISPEGNLLWEIKQNPIDYYYTLSYNHTTVKTITSDDNGNIYVAGSFNNRALTIGSVTFNRVYESAYVPENDMPFVAKINAAGEAQWIIGGVITYLDRAGVITDILYVDDQHIYFSLTGDDKITFTNGGYGVGNSFGVVQINSAGNFIANHTIVGLNGYIGNGLRLNKMSTDEVLVTGMYVGLMNFGAFQIQSNPGSRFAAILNPASGWVRAHNLYKATGALSTPPISLDQNDNIYVSSSYRTTDLINVPTITVTLDNQTAFSDTAGSFVAKYDISGNLKWFTKNSFSFMVGVDVIDESNELFIGGYFANSDLVLNLHTPNSSALKTNGGTDAYLLSYNLEGEMQWAELIGSNKEDVLYSMSRNSCNEISLIGRFRGKGKFRSDSLIVSDKKTYIAKFSPSGSCASPCNAFVKPLKVDLHVEHPEQAINKVFTLKIKFNRNVTGFDSTDIIVSNAVLSHFSGSGVSYSAIITPIAQGDVTARVLSDAATDGSIGNLPSNIFSIRYDTIAPLFTISANQFFNGNFLKTYVHYPADNDFTALKPSDFELSNCKIGIIQRSYFPDNAYELYVIPFSPGTISIRLKSGVTKDVAGNYNDSTTVVSSVYDITKPVATITTTATSPTAISPIPITITFNEPVSNFEAGSLRFTWSGCSITNFQNPSGDLKTYTAGISITQPKTNYVTVDVGVRDLAGNQALSNQLTFIFDNTIPTATLTSTATSTTGLNPIPINISFNKKIFGLQLSSFVVTNGQLSNLVQKTSNTYTLQLTPDSSGLVSLKLPAGVVSDTTNLVNLESNLFTRTYDGVKPQVAITSTLTNPTKTSPVPITFTWTKNVTGFTVDDIIVTNGTLNTFAGSGKVYTVNVVPYVQGTVTLKINANSVVDAGAGGNTASSLYITTYDNVRPTATVTTPSLSPTRDTVVHLTYTFTEAVVGFTQSDLVLTNATIVGFSGAGTTYFVDVKPTNIGAFNLNLSTAYTDLATNTGTANFYTNTFQGNDYTSPTIILGSAITGPTKLTTIPITITLSEDAASMSSTMFTVTNGSISWPTGSGTSYTANLTPTTAGPVTVKVLAGAFTDKALLPNLESNTLSIVYDNVKPVISIASGATNPTAQTTIPVALTATESIVDLTLSDITVSNGTVSNLTGSGSLYSFDLTPAAPGLVSVSLTASSVTDIAGNLNNASSFSITYAVEIDKPSVVISSTAIGSTNSSPIPISITFSEPVTGFVASDIMISQCTLSGFTGSGAQYSAFITPQSNGTCHVWINANVASDMALNTNTASNNFTVTYDNIKPTITITSTSSNPTFDSTIPIVVYASELLNDFTIDDFVVTNGTVENFSYAGSTFYVDLLPSSFGTVTVTLNPSAVFDRANNANNLATFSIEYQSTDQTPPVLIIEAVSSSNQDSIPVSFTFTESVTGFTASDVLLTNATITDFAGSGLNYTALIHPISEGTVNISVNAATAFDAALNGNEYATYSLNYDVSAPTATITSAAGDTTNASYFNITVTFSEPVKGFSIADLLVTNATISNLQVQSIGLNGRVFTFVLHPTSDGLVTVTLNSFDVVDEAGNRPTASALNIYYTSVVTPIEEQNLVDAVKLFPNPTGGKFVLENLISGKPKTVTIRSLEGKILFVSELSESIERYEVDLSSLVKGTYLVELSSQEIRINKLLMIQ